MLFDFINKRTPMKKIFANAVILLLVYTVGPVVWIMFSVFKWLGKIKIINPDNLPKLRPGMLIVSNHPDLLDCMYEVFLIPAIFSPQIFLHPLRLAPWFTPDRRNFTDKWWWAWLRPMAISVDRDKKGGISEARKMLNVANGHNRVTMLLPEGGRTCTGKVFQFSESGRKKIRPLKCSVGWLALKTRAPVFTMWLENGQVPDQPGKKLFSWPTFKRGPIIVKFGKIMELNRGLTTMSPPELTNIIAMDLLELADKE